LVGAGGGAGATVAVGGAFALGRAPRFPLGVERERRRSFFRTLFAPFGLSGTESTVVRRWISGTSVLVGSPDRYVPATAKGANKRTAKRTYLTEQIVAEEFERTIRPR
jgi:hypothetical protein